MPLCEISLHHKSNLPYNADTTIDIHIVVETLYMSKTERKSQVSSPLENLWSPLTEPLFHKLPVSSHNGSDSLGFYTWVSSSMKPLSCYYLWSFCTKSTGKVAGSSCFPQELVHKTVVCWLGFTITPQPSLHWLKADNSLSQLGSCQSVSWLDRGCPWGVGWEAVQPVQPRPRGQSTACSGHPWPKKTSSYQAWSLRPQWVGTMQTTLHLLFWAALCLWGKNLSMNPYN